MDEHRKRKLLFACIVLLNIGIPVLIAFWNAEVGGGLLIIGIMFVSRASNMLKADGRRGYNSSVEHNRMNSIGRTILVQVVDDFGRDLLPAETEKRLAEARGRANPRDVVMPVKFKVEQNQPGER